MADSHGAKIKKLFSHSVVYGAGRYLDKVIGFLLIPLYTRYLVPIDYGILTLLGIVSSLGFIVLNVGQSSALFRSYFDYETEQERQAVISTATLLTLSYCVPFTVLFVLFSRGISSLLLGDPRMVVLVILVGTTVIARVFLRIPFSLLRAQEKSGRYSALTAGKGLLRIVVTLVLVVGFEQGVLGILLGGLASEAIFCLILFPGALRRIEKWRFSRATARDLLSFGVPLVPAGVASFVLNLSDRYFLKHYSTIHQVGLYSLGYRLGEVVWEIVSALHLAYPQFVLSNEKSSDAKRLYSRVLSYYFAGIGFLVLALAVCAQEVVAVMAAPEYYDAYRVIPLIALGEMFHGLVLVGPVGLTLKRKTIYVAYTTIIAAGANVLLNFLWIPSYGMMGAAVATLVAFVIQSVLIMSVAQWYYPLPFEYSRLFKLAGAGALVYFGSTAIPANDTLLLTLGMKAILLLLFPCLLVALRFFQEDEIESAARLVRTVKGKLGLVG